jgi:hypothetical protein
MHLLTKKRNDQIVYRFFVSFCKALKLQFTNNSNVHPDALITWHGLLISLLVFKRGPVEDTLGDDFQVAR